MGRVKLTGFSIILSFRNSPILIGKGTGICSTSVYNLLGMYQRTILVARHGGRLSIGKNVGISGSTIYAMKDIRIGDNTFIGVNCKIVDSDFHAFDVGLYFSTDPRHVKMKPVSIGKNCFIGMNSIILKGTVIGDNSIVGAGSVVSGHFPENVVIAGNPARIIKYR
ncbi:acyltransferase [uncultured Parabacteroides sp.]|uniref:acyltransferase n=1 Tax=uncultured Parabacteroides sp. TaxID=512312 RepID=UPI00259B21B9|nr:acyltransferase [uncultured Parabacteroides sp.]